MPIASRSWRWPRVATPSFAAQVARYRPRAIAMATGAALDELRQLGGGAVPPRSWRWQRRAHSGRDASGRRPRALRFVRDRGARSRPRGDRGRQDHRAREQGSARDGRRAGHGCGAPRGVAILPVDSEHNAIHQCLHGRGAGELRRLSSPPRVDPSAGAAARASRRVTARTRSSIRRGRWGRRSRSTRRR